mgnify:CR=1 FL=1
MRAGKFTDLSGSAEQTGDLKSVVLHSMTMSSVQSDFDVPIGVKLSGVDNSTFSLTGEAYSTIVPPKSVSTASRVLQKDDVALAYEFARKVSAKCGSTHRVGHALDTSSQIVRRLSRVSTVPGLHRGRATDDATPNSSPPTLHTRMHTDVHRTTLVRRLPDNLTEKGIHEVRCEKAPPPRPPTHLRCMLTSLPCLCACRSRRGASV